MDILFEKPAINTLVPTGAAGRCVKSISLISTPGDWIVRLLIVKTFTIIYCFL